MRLCLHLFLCFSFAAIAAPDCLNETELKASLMERISQQMTGGIELKLEKFFVSGPVSRSAKLAWLEPQVPVGMVQFEYRWSEEGQPRRVRGNGEVLAYGKVAVARTPIRHGEVFGSHNILFDERLLNPHFQTGYFQQMAPLARLRANGYLRPGVVVGSRSTQVPHVIEAGQTVELLRENPVMKLAVQVRALQRGRIMDWIQVMNPSSRKMIKAQVVGEGKVRIP